MVGDDLLELAREPSSEKRSALLRRITDLFFDGLSERNVSENALFDEIVLRVMQDVDVRARAAFADQVADEAGASHRLVMRLARDEIAVARPVLERSPVLADAQLVELIAEVGDEHRQAICRRRSLSAVVTDVLLEHGSASVRHLLVANSGARFSTPGFGRLVQHAQSDESLRYGLANRPDLPADVVGELSTLLSAKLRETLGAMGLEASDQVAPAMLQQLQARLSAKFDDREHEVREVAAMARDIRAGLSTIDREVAELARGDRAFDIASLVADLVHIDHATAMKALSSPNEEPMIVLMRCLDASWETFEQVLELRCKRRREAYARNPALMAAYHGMDRTTAQRVLRFLQVRRTSETRAA
ncbi:DUF2336 domain-containing protein [Labrys wisconsinensis]|uniref:DUF2336 domain-containing protein n=1 Tax=Labrys wisconsinensis TaxID=425677 RepID=A0ABU0IZL8_9HYPH|nr:DUF2336 domain-containing protein [Labrys wisconsinensis]MDQ0467449.1 hypothetical protein [Labrys wisconsinensis]